jgi:hypothetical protein
MKNVKYVLFCVFIFPVVLVAKAICLAFDAYYWKVVFIEPFRESSKDVQPVKNSGSDRNDESGNAEPKRSDHTAV